MQTCHFVYPKTGGSLSPPSHCLVLGVKVLPRPPRWGARLPEAPKVVHAGGTPPVILASSPTPRTEESTNNKIIEFENQERPERWQKPTS